MMTSEAEIFNIAPFNDFFISCFDNPIYTIVRTFNKSLRPLLANEIVIYRKDHNHKQGLVVSEVKKDNPIDTVIRNLGIGVRNIRKSRDIINDLKNSVANRRLTLISVDCFALPNIANVRENRDYYHQEHHPHFFLVAGCCEKDHSFQVVNSIGDNTGVRQYDFDVTKQGYESYLKYLWDKWTPTYQVFENRGQGDASPRDKENPNYSGLLVKNIRKKSREMKAGFKQLEIARGIFQERIKSEAEFRAFYRECYPIFPQKLVDHSNFQHIQHQMLLSPEHDLAVLRGRIREDWRYIRGVIVRYKCKGDYEHGFLSKAYDKLGEICELEWEYFRKIRVETVDG